jgi:hypothetical protein
MNGRFDARVALMPAVAMWIRSSIRRDWRALVLIALGVAIACGLAMTAAIGASRAALALEQFADRTRLPDVIKEVPVSQSESVLRGLRARPGVTDAVRLSFVPFGPEGTTATGFASRDRGFGTQIYRPIILEGRAADPTRADEFTINRAMADLTGLRPGDHVVIVDQTAASAESSIVRQPATMVGIHVGALDTGLNADGPIALYTPAFGKTWFDITVAQLGPGAADGSIEAVMARVSSPTTVADLLVEDYLAGTLLMRPITAGLDAERTAYTVLAVMASLGTAIAIGQVITRRVRRHTDQGSVLAALGLTPTSRRLALAGSNSAAALVGVAVSPLVAYLASPLAGRGLVDTLDPNGHRVIDGLVVASGTAGAALVFVAVAITAAWRADSLVGLTSPSVAGRRLPLPGPAGLFGGRVASGWGRRSGRTVARSHVVTVSLGLASVAAVAVWSGAARHVVATPGRFGATWDAAVVLADDTATAQDPMERLQQAIDALSAAPHLGSVLGRGRAGMIAADEGMIAADESRIEVVEIDQQSGSWWPTLVDGRVPRDRHEITVGSGLLDAQHRLGSQLELAGEQFTIVGEHVLSQFSNGDFGMTVALIFGMIPQADLDAPTVLSWVDLTPGTTIEQLATTVGAGFEVWRPTDVRPGEVINLGRLGGLDEVLLLICVMLVVASLANGTVISTNARRRDHATMRALGAGRSTIRGSVLWHVAVVAAIGAAAGIPVGLVAGVASWQRTAHAVHVGTDTHHIALVAVAVLAGLTAAAAVLAAITGSSACRHSRRRLDAE